MQNWKALARLLLVPESDIIETEYANQLNISNAVHEMLNRWQTRHGKKATPQVLADSLQTAKMQGVIGKFYNMTAFCTCVL